MLISFGEFNIKCILFILVPIFMFCCRLSEKNLDYEENLFFVSFIKYFSRSFSFILWIILNQSLTFQREKPKEEIINKDKEQDKPLFENNENEDILNDEDGDTIKNRKTFVSEKIIYERKIKKKEKIKIKIILEKIKSYNVVLLYTIILGFIGTFIKYIFAKLEYREHVSAGLSILSSCTRLCVCAICSYFFLGDKKFEKHQYFSAAIIGAVAIILTLLSYFTESKTNNKDFIIKLILMIIPEILYCFMYICGAIYLIRGQGNIYKIIFFNGVFALTCSIIIQIVVLFFNCNKIKHLFVDDFDFCDGKKYKTIIENFKSFKKFGGILTFALIIFNFVEIICIWLLINYFSVNHLAAIYTVPSIFYFIFEKKNLDHKIFYIIGFIVIFFMTLIYNEILVLNILDLNKNTKMEINRRADTESEIKPFIDDVENDKVYQIGDD